MKTSLIITTINRLNKNIRKLSFNSKKKIWEFIVIGDKKSPKKFPLKYGEYLNINNQEKSRIKFAKICPENNYARKNIGYLYSMKSLTPSQFLVSSTIMNITDFFPSLTLSS